MPARGSGRPISVLTPAQQAQFEALTRHPKFVECLDHLTLWRSQQARKTRAHPFLSREDLRGVAVTEAFITFSKYVNRRVRGGKDGLRRLVIQGMKWALLKEYKRARIRDGYEGFVYAALDAPDAGVGNGSNDFSQMENEYDLPDAGGTLQSQVAEAAGEPDPLAVLLIKERVERGCI